MKKLLFSFLIILIIMPVQSFAKTSTSELSLTKRSLTITLSPYLSEAISKYKEKANYYAPFTMNYDLWNTEISNITKRDNTYLVSMETKTFEHAHSPPSFDVKVTISVKPSDIKIKSYDFRKGPEVEQVEKFYRAVISDIRQSFDVGLDAYNFKRYENLPASLRMIVNSISKDILQPEINPPYKNVIQPVTFIKEKEGYILFKQADGTNVMYSVQESDEETWKITNIYMNQGKKMPKDLIWYM